MMMLIKQEETIKKKLHSDLTVQPKNWKISILK